MTLGRPASQGRESHGVAQYTLTVLGTTAHGDKEPAGVLSGRVACELGLAVLHTQFPHLFKDWTRPGAGHAPTSGGQAVIEARRVQVRLQGVVGTVVHGCLCAPPGSTYLSPP